MENTNHVVQTGSAKKWGPVQLMPNVKPSNMTVYVLGAMFAMLLSTFVPQAQPFILTEIMHIPANQQGVLTGYLGLAATIVGLIVPGIWGTLSDKVGRRIVYAIGLTISALGIVLYPLAGGLIGLYLCRSLFSAGSNASQTMSTAFWAITSITRTAVRHWNGRDEFGYWCVAHGLHLLETCQTSS